MSGSAVLTLIAIVASIEGTVATVEGDFVRHLRPGDTGRVHYEITVANEVRTIEIGTAEVVLPGATEVQVRIASIREILPGFGVRFELPFERVLMDGRKRDLARANALEAARGDLAESDAEGTEAERRRLAGELAQAQEELHRLRAALDAAASTGQDLTAQAKEFEADPAAAQIEARVLAWAAAWSAQDAEAYLSFYSAGHGVTSGSDRSQWEAQRRKRLLAPEFIEVEVEEFELLSSATGRGEVRFVQSYRSNTFQDKVTKRMSLVLEKDAWKIISEKAE